MVILGPSVVDAARFSLRRPGAILGAFFFSSKAVIPGSTSTSFFRMRSVRDDVFFGLPEPFSVAVSCLRDEYRQLSSGGIWSFL